MNRKRKAKGSEEDAEKQHSKWRNLEANSMIKKNAGWVD